MKFKRAARELEGATVVEGGGEDEDGGYLFIRDDKGRLWEVYVKAMSTVIHRAGKGIEVGLPPTQGGA